MKRIKITDTKMTAIAANADAIVAALYAVNGRSNSFCITTWSEVVEAAKDAEKALSAIPKAGRIGTILSYRLAGPSANRYGYRANATLIWLERTSSGWYLRDATMSTVYPREAALFEITITPATRDAIVKAALAPFSVPLSTLPV